MSRVRSWLAAPRGVRLLGVVFAVTGVALLVLGVLAFGGSDDPSPGAAPAPTTAVPTGLPSPSVSTSPAPSPSAPATTGAPSSSSTSQLPAPSPSGSPTSSAPAPARAPLTVLNNSTIRGLGERAAADARSKGWTVASVGNFAGVIPVTTVYFTPGNAAEEAAAEQLAVDLPQVDRVMARYEGLPPTPTGIVLVVTRYW